MDDDAEANRPIMAPPKRRWQQEQQMKGEIFVLLMISLLMIRDISWHSGTSQPLDFHRVTVSLFFRNGGA